MSLWDLCKKALFSRKEYLLEWQNKVLVNPNPKLVLNKNQLRQATTQTLNSDLRIIKDCISLVQSTKKPDVFFMRLDLLEKTSMHAASLEQYVSFDFANPSDLLIQLYKDKNMLILEFLERYYFDLIEKTDSLKTQKGKINKCNKYRENLQPYWGQLTYEHIKYIEPRLNLYFE